MAVTIQCPNPECGVTSAVADSISGRSVKCKRCGTPFVAKPTMDGLSRDTGPNSGVPSGDPFPTLPAKFGRYVVQKKLGQGGMGAVYLAEDTELNRKVALKLPAFAAGESPQRIERFVREAKASAALQHPNICTVYDAGKLNGRPFISMAFIDGKPLEALIDPEQPMPPERAAELARKIAAGLAHAHAKGIVHRDLKPANIMVTAEGEPIVMDFGLAKRLADVAQAAAESKLTQQGAIMGTPTYMAPEQVRGDIDEIRPTTDVYALGVILFEMLTGRTPYSGRIGVVMGQILHAPVPEVSEFRTGIDPRLAAICKTAMAKEAASRFPDMAAFMARLDDYLKSLGMVSVSLLPQAIAPTAVPISTVVAPPTASPFGDLTEDEDDDQAEQLTRRSSSQTKSRSRKQQPASNWPWLVGAGLALFAAVLVAGVILLLRTKHGEVVVELSDPTAKVQVAVDGDTVELTGLDRPLKLTAGEHGLTVTGSDFETVTQKFTVKRGEKEVVRVTLKPKAKPAPIAKVEPPKPAESPQPLPQPPAPQPATPPTQPNPPLPMTGEGFAPLFNGKDLTGWKGLPQLWSVQGGTIVGSSQPNGLKFNTCLCADGEYGDFELSFQIKLSEGANSGVQIRSKLFDADQFIVEGPQCDAGTKFWGSLYGERFGGMMQAADADLVARTLKPNEFNELFVRCVGNRVTIKLNGVTTVDRDFDNLPAKGLIGLQLHGGLGQTVEFRNIQFKDLTTKPNAAAPLPLDPVSPGFVPLFNGKDLTGWIGSLQMPANARIQDGYLQITPGSGNIQTVQEFGPDFELHTEFWLPLESSKTGQARANSGIFIQGRYEIQILDSLGYNIRPDVACGSLYGMIAPSLEAAKPPKQWQSYDIIFRAPLPATAQSPAQKGELTVIFNGKTIIDRAPLDKTSPGGISKTFSERGPIILQDHGSPVRFRNLRIRPIPPRDVISFGEGQFKIYTDQLTWKDGKARCEQLGGRLVIINSEEQNRFLSGLVSGAGLKEAWIGFTDEAEEGQWVWVDGSVPTYTKWGYKQPNNKAPGEQFALLWAGGKGELKANMEWIAQPNAALAPLKPGFICEWVAPPVSAAPQPMDDFVPLFNGKDLTGWKSYGKPTWEWKGGRLVGKPSADRAPGFLMTESNYSDVELELEYKANAGLGTGLFLRADPNGQISGAEFLEVQICDDIQFAGTPYKTGAIYNAFARKADPPIKAGDWNTLRVKLVGRKLEVWINGTQTVDANLDDAQGKLNKAPGLVPRSGRIGLQQNQQVDVEFRNVRMKYLSKAAIK